MYTVLLTDDEQAVLDALISGISWSQLGVDNLLTASDGIAALQIMKNTHVDLLISDIRMPHMDGLELLRQVRTQFPDTHCILLTAYGEFEYARSALQMGVENYLLKPFQQEEMEKTIEKALDNLYVSRQNSEQLFRNNILSRWVNDSISSEELGERVSLLNINIYLNTYCVICIRKRKKACSASAYGNNCLQILGPEYEAYPFWDNKGRYVMILGGNKLSITQLKEVFSTSALETRYQDAFFISIGSIVSSSEQVGQSYQTSCNLLETSDCTNGCISVFAPDNEAIPANDALLQVLHTLFHQEDAIQREKSYQELASKMLQKGTNTQTVFSHLARSLSQLFEQEFPNKPGLQKEIYGRIHLFAAAPLSPNGAAIAIRNLLEYSYLMFRYYFEQLSPVIQHAIGYIHKHYMESLSIKEFCAKSKMSTAYLGYLFKKETGMFFNNYLTQYRICSALQLLSETDLQINDIAKKLGFSSTSYFISCFKKQVGLSPIKYRTLKIDI